MAKQLKLRLKALGDTFQHANALTTENKREVRVMELKDSIIFDELYSCVSSQYFTALKQFKMFDNSYIVTREDERGNAELPDIYTKEKIEEIKKQYGLI